MKQLIILIAIVLLSSCGEIKGDGVETVKTLNGLKVKTTSLYNNRDYPEYIKGDTVIIWRKSSSSVWYISITDDTIPKSVYFEYRKGVVQ